MLQELQGDIRGSCKEEKCNNTPSHLSIVPVCVCMHACVICVVYYMCVMCVWLCGMVCVVVLGVCGVYVHSVWCVCA